MRNFCSNSSTQEPKSQWSSPGQILFFGTCLRKKIGYTPASLQEGTSYSVTLNFEKRFNNHRSIIFCVNFHCFKKNKSTSLCSYWASCTNSFKKYVIHSGRMGRNFSKKICEIFWFQNDRQVLNYPIKHILYFFDARKALELTFFEQGWTFMQ